MLHFEAGIASAQDSYKVVFPGVDDPFGCVPSLEVDRSEQESIDN